MSFTYTLHIMLVPLCSLLLVRRELLPMFRRDILKVAEAHVLRDDILPIWYTLLLLQNTHTKNKGQKSHKRGRKQITSLFSHFFHFQMESPYLIPFPFYKRFDFCLFVLFKKKNSSYLPWWHPSYMVYSSPPTKTHAKKKQGQKKKQQKRLETIHVYLFSFFIF